MRQVKLRLPDECVDRLAAAARDAHLPLSTFLRVLIVSHMHGLASGPSREGPRVPLVGTTGPSIEGPGGVGGGLPLTLEVVGNGEKAGKAKAFPATVPLPGDRESLPGDRESLPGTASPSLPSEPPAPNHRCEVVGVAPRTALARRIEQGVERKEREEHIGAAARLVFGYWQAVHSHPRALLDRKRLRTLTARLVENRCNLSECLFCIDGAKRDDYLMGRDDRAPRVYDGIETLFRDRAQVERLSALGGYQGQDHPFLHELVNGATPGGGLRG